MQTYLLKYAFKFLHKGELLYSLELYNSIVILHVFVCPTSLRQTGTQCFWALHGGCIVLVHGQLAIVQMQMFNSANEAQLQPASTDTLNAWRF